MKKRFSATEFLKQAIESEEQPKIDQLPQTKKETTQPKEERYVVTQKPEPAEEVIPPKTDAVKIDKNFYKVPNAVDDFIVSTLSAAEEVIYRRLIRMSWGWGRNYCRAGIKYFQEASSIKSRTTIKSAIDGLIEKKIIYRYVDESGEIDRNQNGTVYIIPIPSIPDIGILKNGTRRQTTHISVSKQGGSNISIPENGILNIGTTKFGGVEASDNGIPENGTPKGKPVKTKEKVSIPENGIPENDPIKDIHKDSLKDTLSQDEVISEFYKGIGQKRLTKTKRERAEKCIKKMMSEGFSLEDINFAAMWTVKNAKEKLYDFSIVEHTMSQAMADKSKEEAEQARREEREKAALREKEEQEKQEKERAEIEASKEKLDSEERAKLRQEALEEIGKMEGVKKEFISEALIKSRENEILKARMIT